MVQVHMMPPIDREWDQMTQAILHESAEIIGVVVLVRATSGPSPVQRKKIAAVGHARRDRIRGTAILTDSIAIRGVVTAISWLVPSEVHTKAFPLDGLERALNFLQLELGQKVEVQELLALLDPIR